MNQSVGTIIAIVFLVIGNLAFGMLYYQTNLDKLHREEVLRLADKKELATDWKNKNMRQIDEDMLALQETNEKLQENLAGTEDKLAETKDILQNQEELNTAIKQDMEKYKEIGNTKQETIDRLGEEIRALQEKMNEPDLHKDELKQQRDESKLLAEQRMRELLRVKEGWLAAQEKHRSEKTRLVREIEQLREALDKLRHGGEVVEGYERQTERFDGRVLEVDADRRFAVIDAGKVHRIERGMKFEVVRLRYGQEEVMGKVEVTEVFPSTSAVTILSGIEQKPVCSQCGYIGQPGMRYCPYCSSGEGKNDVVRMSGGAAREVDTMDPLDPILPGDYVRNPVYSREEELTFTIAGEPQEFTRDDLVALIKDYGGKVSEAVEVETDYLVLCRTPDAAAATGERQLEQIQEVARAREAAKQFGVPIMREVELLDLLKN